MLWSVGVFLFFVIAISLAVAYLITQQLTGRELAWKRMSSNLVFTLFYSAVTIIFFFSIFFLAPLLLSSENYRQGFVLLCALGAILEIFLKSFSVNQRAGTLLLDIGRGPGENIFLLAGIVQSTLIAINLIEVWKIFANGLLSEARLVQQLPIIILLLSASAYFIFMGSGSTQLREKGIYSLGETVKWEKINSFHWERSKPNTLTFKIRPIPFLGIQKTASFYIHERHKEAVNEILNNYVPTVRS